VQETVNIQVRVKFSTALRNPHDHGTYGQNFDNTWAYLRFICLGFSTSQRCIADPAPLYINSKDGTFTLQPATRKATAQQHLLAFYFPDNLTTGPPTAAKNTEAKLVYGSWLVTLPAISCTYTLCPSLLDRYTQCVNN
jgi:hypothetical protein